MKKANLLVAAVLCAFISPSMMAQSEKEPIAIDEAHFPDPIFRQVVLDRYDTNKNKMLDWSERENEQTIVLDNMGIEDLTGIEHFGNLLKRLEVYGNKLKTIDLSFVKYPEIFAYFDCSDNPLTTLDVSRFKSLGHLNCNSTNITSIKFPDEPHYLTVLNCIESKLKTIDLSTAKYMKMVCLRNNELTSITMPESSLLFDLNISNNRLVNLDLKNNDKLPQKDFENRFNGRRIKMQRAAWKDEKGEPIYFVRLEKVADEPNVLTLDEMFADANFDYTKVTHWLAGGVVKDANDDPRFKGKVLVVKKNDDDSEAAIESGTGKSTRHYVRYHYPNGRFDYAPAMSIHNQSAFYIYWDPSEAEDPIVTGVTDMTAQQNITGVTYYNLAGAKLATPQQGVNIVVTHYSDGSTTAVKKAF